MDYMYLTHKKIKVAKHFFDFVELGRDVSRVVHVIRPESSGK